MSGRYETAEYRNRAIRARQMRVDEPGPDARKVNRWASAEAARANHAANKRERAEGKQIAGEWLGFFHWLKSLFS